MAPPPDEYATPSGGAGRLKLKGSSKPQDGNRVDKNKDKDKKKKKKKKERKKDKDDEDRDGSPSFARPQDHDGRGGGDGDDGDRDRDRGSREASEAAGDGETVLADKTEAEKRYEGTRKRRVSTILYIYIYCEQASTNTAPSEHSSTNV